jgi:hypothetical protein
VGNGALHISTLVRCQTKQPARLRRKCDMDKVHCIDIGFAGTLGELAGDPGSKIALPD